MTTDSVSGATTPPTQPVSADGFSGNIDVMVQMVFLQYNQLMNQRTQDKLEETKSTLKELNDAQQMMAKMKQKKQDCHGGCTEMSADMVQWLADRNIATDRTGNDNIHNSDEWDVNISNLDSYTQKISGMNKTQMLELNQCVEDGNNALREVSTVFSKYTEIVQSIIQTINR